MTSSLKLTAALAIAAAGLAFAAPAQAEIQRPLTLQIQYDNSALGTETGALTVLESLQQQADDACRYTRPVLGGPRVDDACTAEVVAKAVASINDAALTDAYIATTAHGVRMLASLD